jgi:hypothetical protein
MDMQQNVLDKFETRNKRLISNSTILVLLLLSIVATVIDTILIMDRSDDLINSGNNLYNSKMKMVGLTLLFHLIVLPAASLLLSFLFSLIPLRQKQYSEKYLSVATIVMTFLQFLFLTFTFLGI